MEDEVRDEVVGGEVPEEPERKISDKSFYYVIIGLLILTVGIVLLGKLMTPEAKTLSDLQQDALQGDLEGAVEYDGFVFINISGMWYTQWEKDGQVYNVPLRFNPYQVEDVVIEGELGEGFGDDVVYVTFDPDEAEFTYLALGAAELSLSLARALDIAVVAACTKNLTDACETRPIVNCSDEDKTIIYLKLSDDPRLILGENCVIVQGDEFELIRVIDRMLYQWYRIMK